ncbi:macrophage scavenger receptor types I and II-like, partial [Actinia tenebrosa]|uniref:Macrophage scavenger receptor types I and II-like n=1 Tax=Actinia tenebrosa TaxID=6105 RepID=A0A6P8IAA4_ACTTE
MRIAVRLVDGRSPNEGRVEVRYNGTWGTICKSKRRSYIETADVICKMLNYKRGVRIGTALVKGTGPILLKGLDCYGGERSIDECPHDGWLNTNGCHHKQDVRVICHGRKL